MTDESNLSGQAQVDEAGQGEAGEGTSSASVKCCTDCELTFSTLAKYKYHRLRLHGAWKAGFPCPDCHATFSSVSNLKRHRKKVHEQEADPPSASGPICPYPHCGHVAKDNHHLKVHMRKHTGERPFECPLCSFGFYKKSDLTKHQKGCGGVKFRCSACAKPFHFKRQLQEHLVWSKSCGVMELEEDAKATPSRYMNPGERPSIVRLNVSRDQSVVGVNCPIDEARYVKRKRRARCGLCNGCQRTDDCDACSNCRGECKKTRCKLRDVLVVSRVKY